MINRGQLRSALRTTLLSLYLATLTIAGPGILAWPSPALAEQSDAELANELALLLRSARKVISDNQAQINRVDIADKGLSADAVLAKARENFRAQTDVDLESLDGSTRRGGMLTSLQSGIHSVMENAQPLINSTDVAFKGFLPAVFAREVATAFNQLERNTAFIKLTAPEAYVRNRANRPDKWETAAIEDVFKAPGHVKGQAYSEMADHKGKPGFRLIIPEYYGASCLNCHGDPKGERDITGGKKEGGKLGELGGAISVVIYKAASASSPANQ